MDIIYCTCNTKQDMDNIDYVPIFEYLMLTVKDIQCVITLYEYSDMGINRLSSMIMWIHFFLFSTIFVNKNKNSNKIII